MGGFVSTARLEGTAAQPALWSGLIAFAVVMALAAAPLAVAAGRKLVTAARPITGKLEPDTALIAIYKDLAANDLQQAQRKADALVLAYPNFSLGQLIRGDLLLMHVRPVTGLGSGSNGPPDKLADLREEALVRVKSLRERPDPELVPRALLRLRDDQRYALVVDAKRSRLYVYENLNGQLKLLSDYYITQGKLGTDKSREGDQKTPVGVYYITGRLARTRLPDFYGAGALPINYPNEWDRINGRSGSGIWLHGTPTGSYSRPPLASDGCVVLTNPDLEKLLRSVQPGKTPIVISDRVEFVTRSSIKVARDAADHLLEDWRRDLQSLNQTRFIDNYSSHFKSAQGDDVAGWMSRQQQVIPATRDLDVKLQDVTIFAYPGRNDLLVSTFTQDATFGRRHHLLRKRQYWAKEGKVWKIVYEGNL